MSVAKPFVDERPRKFVKPAHPGACIPDPAHRGMDLPQAGASVVWDHYWIGRLERGEIELAELPGAAAPAAAPTATTPAKPAVTDGSSEPAK